MASAIMTLQDQRGGPQSNSFLPTGDQTSLDISPHSVKSIQLEEHFTSGDDYAPKVRKPYTITKQRERWTEDEHKKFLEALRLYGRAWRRIEEHVGTKTAVQIRSHAQKFFSKVVRESSGRDASLAKPIEIPPPRPKRKPMHPYPRKLITPLKTMVQALDQPTRSTSPNSSVSEQENQSPTSVLSRVGSDTIVTADLHSPNGSPSQVSSPAGIKHSGLSLLEPILTPEENGASVPVDGGSVLDEQAPVKLELFPEDNTYEKGVLAGAGYSQSLKLFGKTVLVIDAHRPSSPTMGTCKSLAPEMNDGRHVQTLPWQLMPMKLSLGNEHSAPSASPCGTPRSIYYMQFRNAVMDQAKTDMSPTSLWDSYAGASFPSSQLCSPVPVKLSGVDREALGKESQMEGSWSGSNNGSAEVDVDADSCQHSVDKEDSEHKLTSAFRLCETAVKSEGKTGSITSRSCSKGFVPYKRSLALRDTYSSTVTDEERDEHRIRLCL